METRKKAPTTTAKRPLQLLTSGPPRKKLQAGLVLDEDGDHDVGEEQQQQQEESGWTTISSTNQVAIQYIQEQEKCHQSKEPIQLYHDPDFLAGPSAIEGAHTTNKTGPIKCRCSPPQPAALSYSQGKRTPRHKGRPYYHCSKRQCPFFRWAFQAQLMHWYRFGLHTQHVLVKDASTTTSTTSIGYSAQDLLQGQVGDCWFLSALAVIAERPDLIQRLFPRADHPQQQRMQDQYGIVQVKLFMDGFWKIITMDNFLPCVVEAALKSEEQQQLEMAFKASLADGKPTAKRHNATTLSSSSEYDPFALSDHSRQLIHDTKEFLSKDRARKDPSFRIQDNNPTNLHRIITSNDLAYSKAKYNQLWVPFLEKAYAKIHGSYQAISGGFIAEAFLDLTGAPTLVYNFDAPNFSPKHFWSQLLTYRKQTLPMGCGTTHGGAGLMGRHAYSILDVCEINEVGVEFFRDKLLQGTMGNVSGFTEYDGTVRLLRIRNPHGQGEWKGDFSDHSAMWEKLLTQKLNSVSFQRTMKNDGTFWIDYDHFLMGFSNVDVVLAFPGNHAKSFQSNFPIKKSPHRCQRAFEVTMLQQQPGLQSTAKRNVQLYVMGIQKTRRGATRGRADRKKSYKICDLGFLVGTGPTNSTLPFHHVDAKMLGLCRMGHLSITLNRDRKPSVVIMPISFGHPAATDKELSFVVRFVSDAPVMIRELPHVPRMNQVIQKYCIESSAVIPRSLLADTTINRQGQTYVLLEDPGGIDRFGTPLYRVLLIDCFGNGSSDRVEQAGGTVFFYLHVNDEFVKDNWKKILPAFAFSIEAKCRGMLCRAAEGLVDHEKVPGAEPRKKFEAAWRKFQLNFHSEVKSRLLMVLVQAGQDCHFKVSDVSCKSLSNITPSTKHGKENITSFFPEKKTASSPRGGTISDKYGFDSYDTNGIFAGIESQVFDHQRKENIMRNMHGYNLSFDPTAERQITSQSDLELQQVLEISKHGREDKDLLCAIEMSKLEHKNDINRNDVIDMTTSETEGADIARAIELSLRDQETGPPVVDICSGEGKLLHSNAEVSNFVDLCSDDDGS